MVEEGMEEEPSLEDWEMVRLERINVEDVMCKIVQNGMYDKKRGKKILDM